MAQRGERMSLLLEILDAAFSGHNWNGPSLRGALRGVNVKQAQWRPAPGRVSIWEYVLHCAYWKYVVRQRLSGERPAGFGRSPENFPSRPSRATTAAWRADIRLLEREHKLLKATIAGMRPSDLKRRAQKGWRNEEQVHGVASHDVYHTGQIQLLKALMR